MARTADKPRRPERRPRKEIDRNYFLGDIFIKTGVAVTVALCMIALYTPFTFRQAIDQGMYDYLGVMSVFGVIAVSVFLLGRHLRREATHWDFD
ncbi:MAG: hypothetical protein WDM79_09170 [Terricaulis sp.]